MQEVWKRKRARSGEQRKKEEEERGTRRASKEGSKTITMKGVENIRVGVVDLDPLWVHEAGVEGVHRVQYGDAAVSGQQQIAYS